MPRRLRDRAVAEGREAHGLSRLRRADLPRHPGTGLTHSKTDLHYRAKRAGFSCLKKVQKGEYEKMY